MTQLRLLRQAVCRLADSHCLVCIMPMTATSRAISGEIIASPHLWLQKQHYTFQ